LIVAIISLSLSFLYLLFYISIYFSTYLSTICPYTSHNQLTTGTRQSIEDGDCETCAAGSFTAITDALTCELCPPGKVFGEQGSCEICPEFTYNEKAGASACQKCPGGMTSTPLREYCDDCSFFYTWDSGHCETPVLGILLLVFGFVIVLLVAIRVRKEFKKAKHKRMMLKKHLEETESKQEEVRKEIELMQKAWQINWDRIKIGRKIAAGGQGVVYRGTMQGLKVAVKTIFQTNDSDMMSHNEVKWMQRARHSRLVMFLGCGREPRRNNIFVVMEYMNGGNFLDALESRRLSWKKRVRILCDVAEGMMYVHDELERIHRDLKSENVLLCVEDVNSGNMLRGKVADFGLSGIERDVVCGTTAYMAPELLEKKSDSSSQCSKAADVYAFGVILWEAMHQKRATTRNLSVVKKDEPVGYVELMNVCMEKKIDRRPNFKTIRESLLWMMNSIESQKKREKKKKPRLPPPPPRQRKIKRKLKRPPPPTPENKTRNNKTKVTMVRRKEQHEKGQDAVIENTSDAMEIAVGIGIDIDDIEKEKIDMMDL